MRYFRAFMWLGRLPMRLLPYTPEENVDVETRAALLLAQLAAENSDLLAIDSLLLRLIGESGMHQNCLLTKQPKQTKDKLF